MNNQTRMIRTSNSRAASRTKAVSKVARNPAKVVSSRAGRTSPVSKVVSSADPKSKARQTPGFFFAEKLPANSGGLRFLVDYAFGDLR